MSVDNWAELVAEEENIVSKMCFAMAGLQSFEWEQAPFFVAPVPLFQSRFSAAVNCVRIALVYLVCPVYLVDLVYLVCPVYLVDLVYQVGLADPGGPSAQLDPVVDLHGDPSVGQLGDLRADRVADPHADLPFGPFAGLHDDPLDDPFGDLGDGLLADRRSHYGHRPARCGHCYHRRVLTRYWLSQGHYYRNHAHYSRSQGRCYHPYHGLHDYQPDRWPLPPAPCGLVDWSVPRRDLSVLPAPSKAISLWIFVS
jgi:hypothetical protein